MALHNNLTSLVDSQEAGSIGNGKFQVKVTLPANKSFYEGQLKIYFHGASGFDYSTGGVNIYNLVYNASENHDTISNGLTLNLVSSIKNSYQTSDLAGYQIDSVIVTSPGLITITISSYGSHPPFTTPFVTAILSDFNAQNSFSTTNAIMVSEFKTNVCAKAVKGQTSQWSLTLDLPGNTDFYLGELELVYRGQTGMESSIGGCLNYLVAWATSNKVLFNSKGKVISKTSEISTQYETFDLNGYSVDTHIIPPSPEGNQSSRQVVFNFSGYGPNPPTFPPVCTLVFRGLPFITKYEAKNENESLFKIIPKENYATIRELQSSNLKVTKSNFYTLDVDLPTDFNFFNGTIEFDIKARSKFKNEGIGLKIVYKIFGTTSAIINFRANGKKIQLISKTPDYTKNSSSNPYDIAEIQFISQKKIRVTFQSLGTKPSKVFPEISIVYKGYWSSQIQAATVQKFNTGFEIDLKSKKHVIDNIIQVGCMVHLN